MSNSFVPPIALGDVVLYRVSRGSQPFPAMVTGVGARALSLAVFTPFSSGCKNAEAVRYIDDPINATSAPVDGVWEYSDSTAFRYSMQDVTLEI